MIFKANTTSAFRWWKNGDHPNDDSVPVDITEGGVVMGRELTEGKYVGFYEPPEGLADILHTECGSAWRNHGYIETGGGRVVCPGNWIVQRSNHHWEIVPQTVSGYEADENVGDDYVRVWECVEEKEQHKVDDPEIALIEASSHATAENHLISIYGVPGADE